VNGEIICRSGNERQQACREILGTQNRSNGYIGCSVRLGTLEDGDTDAHMIAPSLPSSPLRDRLPDPMSRTVADVNGYNTNLRVLAENGGIQKQLHHFIRFCNTARKHFTPVITC
jgi:hypothetical protein